MKKTTYYVYLGTNGTITSTVHLEDIYYVNKYQLIADEGKVLTKDDKTFRKSVMVSEQDLSLWHEVDDPGQE